MAILSDVDRREIWECWWHGCSKTFILNSKMPYGTRMRDINKVLSEDVPESLRQDERASGRVTSAFVLDNPGTLPDETCSMVLVRHPVRIGRRVWDKGVRALAAGLKKNHGARLSYGNAPMILSRETVGRCLDEGYLRYAISEDGSLVPFVPDEPAKVLTLRP